METPSNKKFKHIGNVQRTTYPDRLYTFNEVFEHILKENRKDLKTKKK